METRKDKQRNDKQRNNNQTNTERTGGNKRSVIGIGKVRDK